MKVRRYEGTTMSGTERSTNVGADQSSEDFVQSTALDNSENLMLDEEDMQLEEQEPQKKKSKRVVYALLALGGVVLFFAMVAIFFAVQAFENHESENGNIVGAPGTGGTAEGVIEETESILDTSAIIVARQTDYIFYNANLDEERNTIDPDVGAAVEVADEVFIEGGGVVNPLAGVGVPGLSDIDIPELPLTSLSQANRGLGANYSNLLGIDVLDAQAMAQAEGYVVHQVFVVCPNVVRNGAPTPAPGEVIDVQTYTMRTDRQRYMFLNVMTTESVASARQVPDLGGMQWQDGRQVLRNAGLGPRYEYERNSVDTKGVVIFQAPAVGNYTPRGSSVIMVLAD